MQLLSKFFIHTALTFYMQLYTLMSFLLQIKRFFPIKNFFSFTHFYKCLHFIFILFLAGFFIFFFGNKGKKYNFMCVKFIFVLSLIICEKRIKNIHFFKYFFFLLQTLSNSADVCALDILLVLHLSVHHDACTHRLYVTLYAAAFWLQLNKKKIKRVAVAPTQQFLVNLLVLLEMEKKKCQKKSWFNFFLEFTVSFSFMSVCLLEYVCVLQIL